MNLSLLQNFKEDNFFLNPFPHIIIENALPEKLYNDLHDAFPISKFNYTNQNNFRLVISAEKIQKDDEISELWKKFMSFHQSKEFCHQVFDIFSQSLVNIYPSFFKNRSELYNLKVATNYSEDADIFVYTSIDCNTPVLKKGSTIGIHVGSPNKFTESLFYLRDKNDTSSGGDLTLHYWRINLPFFLKKIIQAKRKNFLNNIIKKFQFLFIGDRKKIKYSSNTLVMFVDSIEGLHSVTPREVTKNFRKFCFTSVKYKNLKRFYDPYSIIDKALNFENYKF